MPRQVRRRATQFGTYLHPPDHVWQAYDFATHLNSGDWGDQIPTPKKKVNFHLWSLNQDIEVKDQFSKRTHGIT